MVVTCASNKVVECSAAWDFDAPQVTSTCSNQMVVVSTVTNAGCGGTFTATRIWVADNATNIICSQTVTVVDTTPPTITCPAPITVEFQDENGAVVPCVVTAGDTCSAVSLIGHATLRQRVPVWDYAGAGHGDGCLLPTAPVVPSR